MAFIDIPDPGPTRFLDFVKTFEKVGNQFAGIPVGHSPGNYGEDYRFELAGGVVVTFTAKGRLQKQIDAGLAKMHEGRPGLMVFQVTKLVRGESKTFPNLLVRVDPDWTKGPPKATPSTVLKEPKGSQAADTDDDLPF